MAGANDPAQQAALQGILAELGKLGPRALQALGWHLQRNDFYSPLNDLEFLDRNRDLWAEACDPLEIDWNLAHQMEVAAEAAAYVDELRSVPQRSENPAEYCWENPFWNNGDAMVQYGLLRSRKPRRVVEIGCGYSSLLMSKALAKNESEDGQPACQVTLVEPYPRRELLETLPAAWRCEYAPLQRAPLELFETLEAGDVLFYDGSHCAKAGSDVNWFFFRVLPRVKPGVLIHLHDVFFPRDYPESWFFDRGQTWNEQYVLQAFLMNNERYGIEVCNSYTWTHCPEEVTRLFQSLQPAYGASIWLLKR